MTLWTKAAFAQRVGGCDDRRPLTLKHPRRALRAAALALGLALCSAAWAVQPFVVKDIRIEGAQRTEPGTVFTYLPVKVGDRVDDDKIAQAVKALYATGFFSDVRLEVDNDVLVVVLTERPSISQVDIVGAKEFNKDQLKDGLKQVGLSEAKIYDKALLDRAEKEIKRQYASRGFYGAQVNTTVTPQERNRVALAFNITENEPAKIAEIAFVGNQAVRSKELLDQLKLTTPGWFTWFTKNDQYSRQTLQGDLENLRSYYLNRGYLEFNIESTQVSITPEKDRIYITVYVSEGPVYKISDVKVTGNLIESEETYRGLIGLKAGDTFSRQQVVESAKRISDRLANDGYSFSNVNPVPDIDREKRTAAFNFVVDPGKRVYVRRVNISGNANTRDEVIRREMRQVESAWYSAEKIERSRERLNRTQFFKEVNIESPPVAGTQDQVDVNVNVVEQNTGQFQFGIGYSSTDKLVLSASVSKANIFGSGNELAFAVNNGSVNKVYSLSYTNPYWTVDGVSRGFDLYRRDLDTSRLSTTNYRTTSNGAGVRFGVPINEFDTVNFGLGWERTDIKFDPSVTPSERVLDFVNQFGSKSNTFKGSIGWQRDTRDDIFYATKGRYQRVFSEVGLPGGDIKYYQAIYTHQWLTPIGRDGIALSLKGEVGYAGGYGGKPLPFFKNFYAGGVESVRGYETSSLGPRDENKDAVGGAKRITGSAELLFPMPGVKDKSVRLSAFVDGGNVFGKDDKISFGDMRYSAGIGLSWISPIGPLKFSISKPFKTQEGDKLERFQFLLGRVF